MNRALKGALVIASMIASFFVFINVVLSFMLNTDSSLLVWLTLPVTVLYGYANYEVYNRFVKGAFDNV